MIHVRALLSICLIAGALCAQPDRIAPSNDGPATPRGLAERTSQELQWLTKEERKGRGLDPTHEVAHWLEAHFKEQGLLPLFGEEFGQTFRMLTLEGRNVGGVLPGVGWPDDRRHLIISAHHDHLGVRDGKTYPGASDNGAGVAALLQILREWAPRKETLPVTVVFLAFDLEEKGLFGSRFYARRPALPLEDITLFTTMDILGRGVLDLPGQRLVVLGWERSPELVPLLLKKPAGSPLALSFLGADIVGDRSDYVAFRNREVPFLFFTTGENRDYHQPTDDFARIDQAALASQIEYISAALLELAQLKPRPKFLKEAVPMAVEAESVAAVLDAVLAAKEEQGGLMVKQVKGYRERIRAMLEDGDYTAAEHDKIAGIVRTLISLGRLVR